MEFTEIVTEFKDESGRVVAESRGHDDCDQQVAGRVRSTVAGGR